MPNVDNKVKGAACNGESPICSCVSWTAPPTPPKAVACPKTFGVLAKTPPGATNSDMVSAYWPDVVVGWNCVTDFAPGIFSNVSNKVCWYLFQVFYYLHL